MIKLRNKSKQVKNDQKWKQVMVEIFYRKALDFFYNLVYNGLQMTAKKVKSINMNICQRLRELRQRHNLNQADMAGILNVTTSGYQKIETGINEIGCKHILNIKDHFNISTDWLISGKTSIDSQDFEENREHVKKMLADMKASKQVLFSMLSHYYEIIDQQEKAGKESSKMDTGNG
jgi:transcriptional regulator with XRE-family HTH domain